MIAIVDYGMGNLRSVEKAFVYLGVKTRIVNEASSIIKAEKIVFPGVGAFKDAMEELRQRKLEETLKKEIENKKPFMGLCLGLQLLFEESEEAPGIKGLSIFKGKVKKLPPAANLKVPQIGWNQLNLTPKAKDCPMFAGIGDRTFFYFVHSYYVEPQDKNIIVATSTYGIEFTSCVWKDNIFACQFHPEKSQKAGLKILENFCRL